MWLLRGTICSTLSIGNETQKTHFLKGNCKWFLKTKQNNNKKCHRGLVAPERIDMSKTKSFAEGDFKWFLKNKAY